MITCLTVGFTVAQISYDFDTDPKNRTRMPDFYGYVPDKGSTRTSLFMTMVFMFSITLAIKVLGIVIIGIVNMRYMASYAVLDIGLFLIIKVFRDDFIYWLPLDCATSIWTSLLIRVIVKLVTDFTGVVQFRYPYEVGGAQWFFSHLTSITMLFVAWKLAEDSSTFTSKRLEELWWLSLVLTVLAGSLFIVFFLSINKGYIHTFFSLETGGQMTIRSFRTHEDDGLKAVALFDTNTALWKSIRDEMKEWVQQNWERWMDENPAWLDETMRLKIPPDVIPSESGMKTIPEKRDKEPLEASLPSMLETNIIAQAVRDLQPSMFGAVKHRQSTKVTPLGAEGAMTNEEQQRLIGALKRRGSTFT